jgi:hypothetical protein
MMTMTTMMMTMMTTRTATMRKKNPPDVRHSSAHPAQPFTHRTLWNIAVLVCVAAAALVAINTNALAAQKKPSPDDCIFYVTVFTEKGARLPDVSFVAHLAGKAKPRWDGYSDGRGEFAVRVSYQGDYEIDVKAKGYDVQTKKVAAEVGQKLDVVFNLAPKAPKKP